MALKNLMAKFHYFLNKKDIVKEGLRRDYADEMALEFCRNKDNLYTISLFPSHDVDIQKIKDLINESVNVVYEKSVELTDQGQKNHIVLPKEMLSQLFWSKRKIGQI